MVLILVASTLAGCARWAPEPTTDRAAPLPAPKMSPDSVTIETVLVRFPKQEVETVQQIWNSAHEGILDLERRRDLDKNGLRAGLLVGELPLAIREQLGKNSEGTLQETGLAADIAPWGWQMRCRAGQRKELIVRPNLPESMTVVTTHDGKLSGATYDRPTVLFDLRATPHANGSATVRLTPEIQHGRLRQTFVSSDFGVRPEVKRAQHAWKELAIEARLERGQVLMVASSIPPKSLGEALFLTRTASRTDEHVFLLVRLAETQLDELFAPELVEQAHALTERRSGN